ncbi:hypothetical protein [Agrobacterium radiobacter]|uniref:hypothetical protein n=1 Tax=Agrobacterium radiobacter TaxID=362 RepID=UPI001605E27D|nr:hypothetical protein [Agrobacterium radiobacter]MBB4406399.1 hypothetical protein [Agrobacterium radiobacter]MBB4450192.1 hypothetical protein [Agrobacterium radiobacter]
MSGRDGQWPPQQRFGLVRRKAMKANLAFEVHKPISRNPVRKQHVESFAIPLDQHLVYFDRKEFP